MQAYRANHNPPNKGQAIINVVEVLFIKAINLMTFQSPIAGHSVGFVGFCAELAYTGKLNAFIVG